LTHAPLGDNGEGWVANPMRDLTQPFHRNRRLTVFPAKQAIRGLAVALLDITEPRGRGSSDRVSSSRVSLDAMAMVCLNVMGLDQIAAAASSRGNRTPRAMRPIIAMSVLNAIQTIGRACLGIKRIIAPVNRR
jgi:hypothetical protein